MTCGRWLIFTLIIISVTCGAPFVELDTVHHAHSQFQVNLILNENRNHPIILVTTSTNSSNKMAKQILKSAHQKQIQASFSVIVDCNQFQKNLNGTLGICEGYNPNQHKQTEQTIDNYFNCQFFLPSEIRIREKGHTIMKSHNQQALPNGQHFNSDYIAEVIRKNIPDFVTYIEDKYELDQFLQQNSDSKVSKQPKLIYFDQNLLSPVFVKKLSALLDGKIQVGVTDDSPLTKLYETTYDSLVLLQYCFSKQQYQHRVIKYDESAPESSILKDQRISKNMKVRKNRDILLDFEFNTISVYEFDSRHEIEYLQTHGRAILLQISQSETSYNCPDIAKIAQKYKTLLNYVCYSQKSSVAQGWDLSKGNKQFIFVVNSIESAQWLPFSTNFVQKLPRNSTRQRVETELQAEMCLRAAETSQKSAIFFYFSDKTNSDSILIMNYLNSLPEVTSLIYICQIVIPNDQLVKRFQIKPNTMFILTDLNGKGSMQKLQHTKVDNFIQIKMFLREIAIQKLMKVYETRILQNKLDKVSTAEQLTDKCFNKKCIVALLATGRYREEQQMKMMKQLKLQYEQIFKFVWIDGICHWDIPKQLKLLKKKEKVIDRSYVFFYSQKDVSYSLWESKKFWDKKELQKWIKTLRNSRNITHLKFAIDIEARVCQKKSPSASLPDEL